MSSVQCFHLAVMLIVVRILLETIKKDDLKIFWKTKIRARNDYTNFLNMLLTMCLERNVY